MKRTGFRRPSALRVPPLFWMILGGLAAVAGFIFVLWNFTPTFIRVWAGQGRVLSEPLAKRVYSNGAPLWDARVFLMEKDFEGQDRGWWILYLPAPGAPEGRVVILVDPAAQTLGLSQGVERGWDLWMGQWLFQLWNTDRYSPLSGVGWVREASQISWSLPESVPHFGKKTLSIQDLPQ